MLKNIYSKQHSFIASGFNIENLKSLLISVACNFYPSVWGERMIIKENKSVWKK